MGGQSTILLLTGPNTGGKTVSLKTVGLLVAMSQAGMHVPAADGTRIPVFTSIYADIGDEQSIEQSLSTFSSHMAHIIDILHRADSGSLVLLDELGAGTDPLEGAALAQALLVSLIQRGCLTMCTSHHPRLKAFAFGTPGVQNASVDFDPETLSPTFHLTIGLPGRSNALAIARRLGLAEEIIERAQSLISPEALRTDALLASIQEADEAAARAQREAEESRVRAQEMEADLRARLTSVEKESREVLAQARQEARRELEELRSEIRRLRRRLVHQAPTPSSLQEAQATIDRLYEDAAPPLPVREPQSLPGETLEEGHLQAGDTVYIRSLGKTGEVLEVNGPEAQIRVGGFRLRTNLGNLEFRSRPEAPPSSAAEVRLPRVESPGVALHIRGFRADEVAPALDKYLNDACLAGLTWVEIIHGKGMGVQKEVVRGLLAEHPLVSSFRRGELPEGGDGVTVVQLQQDRD